MSSYHGEQKAPCRSCTSFAEYMKQSKKKYNAELNKTKQNTNAEEFLIRSDCPLDRDQLGSNSWSFLHTMAARFPTKPTLQQQHDMTQFIKLFAKFYPCDVCAEDMQKDIKVHPPITNSQDALSQWLCKIHNLVNKKLGKTEFDCTKVNERWRDGWLDGSCG